MSNDEYEKLREETKEAINAVNEKYNVQEAQIKSEYEAGKEATEREYDGLIDRMNVEKLINRQIIKERLNDLGLSDSGLSRTENTAVELSAGNKVAEAELKRKQQVEKLHSLMQERYYELESKRADEVKDIVEAENKSNAVAAESEQANKLKKSNAWDKLIDMLYDGDTDKTQKLIKIESFRELYGLTEREKAWLERIDPDFVETVGGSEDEPIIIGPSKKRKAELKELMNELMTKNEYAGHAKADKSMPTYSQYVNGKLDKWLTEGTITSGEREYMLSVIGG